MNSLISLNFKYMSISPKELVSIIASSKYTKGAEMYIDFREENELKYLDDFVYELKKNDLILQIHGEAHRDVEEQINFIKRIEGYSDYLNKPIVFTLHPLYDEDKNIALDKTLEYLTKLLEYTNSNKVIISLENLDDNKDKDRLGREDINELILNNENIFFTYDMGHELIEFGEITLLDEYLTSKIRNIHIHTNSNGQGHMPIYKDDVNWNSIIKALLFLKTSNYKYNIVFEYGIDYCKGNTLKEKVIDYLESIDYISERIN